MALGFVPPESLNFRGLTLPNYPITSESRSKIMDQWRQLVQCDHAGDRDSLMKSLLQLLYHQLEYLTDIETAHISFQHAHDWAADQKRKQTADSEKNKWKNRITESKGALNLKVFS